MSTLIAIPTTGEIQKNLVTFLLKVNKRDDVEIHFSKKRPVDVNRNMICNYFLDETEHDWLLMIDDDIIPPDNVLEIPEKYSDKDILSTLIFSMKEGIPYPVGSELKQSGKDGSEKLRMSIGTTEDLLELDGVGAGCLFIKRKVLEEMEQPYFNFKKDENGNLNEGEDFNFCLKARKKNFTIHMAIDYPCGHIQKVNFKRLLQLLNLAIKADESKMYYKEVKDNG